MNIKEMINAIFSLDFLDIASHPESTYIDKRLHKNSQKLFRIIENLTDTKRAETTTMEAIDFMSDHKIDYTARSDNGDTLLHAVCRNPILDSYSNAYLWYNILIRKLIVKGASTTALNKDGLTPFEMLSKKGANASTLTLLSDNISPKILNVWRSATGETLLTEHTRARARDEVYCNIATLIQNGVNVNMPNTHGERPLDSALRSLLLEECRYESQANIIHLLIERDAKVSLNTALNLIKGLMYVSKNAPKDFHHYASWALSSLLEKGIDYSQTVKGNTLLHLCVLENDLMDKSDLIGKIAQHLDINTKNKQGLTPLLFAAAFKQEVVFLSTGKKGISYKNKTIKTLLCQSNADVYATDNEGNTILHYLARNNNTKMADFVLKKYPKLALIPNKDGKIPVETAASDEMKNVFIKASQYQEKEVLNAFELLNEKQKTQLLSVLAQLYPHTMRQAIVRCQMEQTVINQNTSATHQRS